MITTSVNAKEGDFVLRFDQDRDAVVLVGADNAVYEAADAISKASDNAAEYVLAGVTLGYLDGETYRMAVRFCGPAMTTELATDAMWRQYTVLLVSTAKASKTRALFEAVDAVLGGEDV